MSFIRETGKIALLIFGLLPFIFFALAFTIVGIGESTTSLFFIILFWLTALSIPGALILYIIHIFRNGNIPKDTKYLWAALLFFGNVFVYPFYWYLYIWRKRKKDRPAFDTYID